MPRKELVDFHRKIGVVFEAYAPLTARHMTERNPKWKGLNILDDSMIHGLANKYNKSPAQIVLNWHLWRGHVTIPNSYVLDHVKENFKVFDFKLSTQEYEQITLLDKGARIYDPKFYKEYERDYYPYFD